MKKIKILAVCGFGVGSSMVLRMKIDDLMKNIRLPPRCAPQMFLRRRLNRAILFSHRRKLGNSLRARFRYR